MIRSIEEFPHSGRPRVTVAAIAEHEGRFLFVEEMAPSGTLVINQPAGHVEHGETLVAAVARESLEETAYCFKPEALVGLYQWQSPSSAQSFLRVCICGQVTEKAEGRCLDDGIVRAIWLSRNELEAESHRWRSPLVARCLDDYLAGERYPLSVCKSLLAV